MTTATKRSATDWKNIARAYSMREANSQMHAESKRINAQDLVKVKELVDERISDVMLKRRVLATFQVRMKYEGLNELLNKHLVEDPDLAVAIAEAAAGSEVDRKNYLTQ